MAHLLETGYIRSGDEHLNLRLELFGPTTPQIDKIHDYRWNLKIQGNKRNQYIKEMDVKFYFEGARPTALEIKEYIPTDTKTELTIVDVNITILTVHIPIVKEKIDVDKVDSAIKWNFKDIDLGKSDTFSELFEGVVTVIFSSDSKNEPLKIAMEIKPTFYKKYVPILGPRTLCMHTPIITLSDVTTKSKDITPYDPKDGKPGDTPNTRIYNYQYSIDDGVLKKGEIRNVSLRAETLSRFFDKLRRSLPGNQCSKIIKEAGKEIGQNFIGDLKTKILNKSKISADEWVYYDSSAGMGRFEVDKNFKFIDVKNSFNAFNIHSDEPICHFLEGYFEGVLSILLEKEVSIDEVYCIAKGDEVCRFKIK